MKTVAFFDLETDSKNHIVDIGCIKSDETTFHEKSIKAFLDFIKPADFICGHNIFQHDLKQLHQVLGNTSLGAENAIDTLYWSPLLFPSKPYHRLVKDDKLQTDDLNNPLNDSIKAKELFYDEIAAFSKLSEPVKQIYFNLLRNEKELSAFFSFLNYSAELSPSDLLSLIRKEFDGMICEEALSGQLIQESPMALCYTLALVKSTDRYSIAPAWVLIHIPGVDRVMFQLRGKPCASGCKYCKEALDPLVGLRRYFGFSGFRSYNGDPLQEKAVRAAIENRSLLAVFPTGGGKSLTFQVPALMAGENTKSLTVIISPLQSLMKDQVDNLEKKGITSAVTINGMLDPIERAKAFERVCDGSASLLYISPESLRSATIERLLRARKIDRFVIDEAHCFSSWGQDFRVDYLYIGEFIKGLQKAKGLSEKIPVSCFTATAKQKVIEDIQTYFKSKLDLDLQVFSTNASRTNLHYKVAKLKGEAEKYTYIRQVLDGNRSPTIIYVARTKAAYKLAEKLAADGFNAKPYHGKMPKEEKATNQNAFMDGSVDIMVATSAFGMGVDKSNVGKVIHYDISDSLENYVQEAGRAGRDENIKAECYVLFNEDDLDKHFILLNQTKLDIKEIKQIWQAIKTLTKTRTSVSNSALEIARKAGWDDNVHEIETRVAAAIAALEDGGYLTRGKNMPRIFANSILSKNAQEAIEKINNSKSFSEKQKQNASRIIKKLFSSKSKRSATGEEAESRIDYISDHLGIVKEEVIQIVQLLKEEQILADTKDLTAFVKKGEGSNRSIAILERSVKLEQFLIFNLEDGEADYNLKELNEGALEAGCKDSSPNSIKSVLNFWAIKNWIKQRAHDLSRAQIHISLVSSKALLKEKMLRRHAIAKTIVECLHQKALVTQGKADAEEILVEFSISDLKDAIDSANGLFKVEMNTDDIEDTLFYLSRIEAIKIEGGFLVLYNKLTIDRKETNNRISYKDSDYEKLRMHYEQKVQQIHIVGEYAKKMIENYDGALQFVYDYFQLNYSSFLNKYFPGTRQDEIKRTLTPAKFVKLFGDLSPAQLAIIKDASNKRIVVAAGPGSGKTRVLVHKLASLLLAEDVKHEQLLMLTFSRAAATEFKKRLLELIGNAAHYVEIKTFHSYCFDLLGRMGNLKDSDSVLKQAIEKISSGNVEQNRVTKAALVVDEAQDMTADEFRLVEILLQQNEEMRVILVGDDDQNIFEFRGSDAKYMQQFIELQKAKQYELVENYRSKQNIVSLSNQWASAIANRLKSYPILAIDRTDGDIRIVEHNPGNLIMPVIESIQASEIKGSTCLLTRTNEEAVQATSLLLQKGYSAKLIQNNDGFRLSNLKEFRWFTETANSKSELPIISDDDWEESKRQFKELFNRSSQLEACQVMIEDFEKIHRQKKYKTDWNAFLHESKFEDNVRINGDTIYVSTIHKVKGKEFDNVFLALDRFEPNSEANKRQFYVAITRAKTNLTIHYSGQYLKRLQAANLTYSSDQKEYQPTTTLCRLLTHRDVQLGYFAFVQPRMNELASGDVLNIMPEGLATKKGLVVKFSKGFSSEIEMLRSKGYRLQSAKTNYIVYWVNETDAKEAQILLPELQFSR